MSDGLTQLRLKIDPSPEVDNEKLEQVTRDLRKELMELDVENVDFETVGEAPKDAKGDVITFGTLLMTLVTSGGVLTSVFNTLQSWLTRHERSKIIIEEDGDKFEVTGNPSQEQQKMFYAWINRHKQKMNTNE